MAQNAKACYIRHCSNPVYFAKGLGRGQIPLTVVAMAEGKLCGSASLIEHDMDNRLELCPWLAGVFVTPKRRRQGIGAALLRRIVDEAIALHIPKLYLYTVNSISFMRILDGP